MITLGLNFTNESLSQFYLKFQFNVRLDSKECTSHILEF